MKTVLLYLADVLGLIGIGCLLVAVLSFAATPLIHRWQRNRGRRWTLVDALCWVGNFTFLAAILLPAAAALRRTLLAE